MSQNCHKEKGLKWRPDSLVQYQPSKICNAAAPGLQRKNPHTNLYSLDISVIAMVRCGSLFGVPGYGAAVSALKIAAGRVV